MGKRSTESSSFSWELYSSCSLSHGDLPFSLSLPFQSSLMLPKSTVFSSMSVFYRIHRFNYAFQKLSERMQKTIANANQTAEEVRFIYFFCFGRVIGQRASLIGFIRFSRQCELFVHSHVRIEKHEDSRKCWKRHLQLEEKGEIGIVFTGI